ncbi:MAG: hypothetical protein WCS65_10690 [Verrucomicrobiae bacterium]
MIPETARPIALLKPMKWTGLLAGALAFAGCSGGETFPQGSSPEFLTIQKADFFVHGPSQPAPPVELPPQEFVSVLRRESGYSIVRLSDGRTGWVDSINLRPSPPSARAASEDDVFPEKAAANRAMMSAPMPDLKLPVEEVTSAGTNRPPGGSR